MADILERLIAAGVKNLKEFGYPHVTAENILTDDVYRAFFVNMVRDSLIELEYVKSPNSVIREAIKELKKLHKELS